MPAALGPLTPTLPEYIRLEKPSRVFSLGTGEHTAQIYSNGEVLVECVRDGASTEAGSLWRDGGPTPLSTGGEFSYYARLGTLSYLVGELPDGMTAVKARLANGDEVTAEISGRLFALWHPRATLEDAVLIASNAQGEQRQAGEPTMMGAVWNEPTIGAMCRNKMRKTLGGPDLSLNPVYSASTAENELRVFGNDWRVVLCRLGRPNSDAGSGVTTLSLADRMPWAKLGPLEAVGNGTPPHVFFFGKAPEGATRVEFHLGDGRVVPATLLGSSLFCVFIADAGPGSGFQKIVGYTPTRIYTRENNVTTSAPAG